MDKKNRVHFYKSTPGTTELRPLTDILKPSPNKGKQPAPTDESHDPGSARYDDVVDAICRMDANALHAELDRIPDSLFNSKADFLRFAEGAFENFRNLGDTYFTTCRGRCQEQYCHLGKEGAAFVGNHSGYHIDLIIETKGDFVFNMYECSLFQPENPCANYGQRKAFNTDRFPF